MNILSFSKQWYCEYKTHVRIHDYFNIMVCNFPLLTFRRLDFGLHGPRLTKVFLLAFLGVTFHWSSNPYP